MIEFGLNLEVEASWIFPVGGGTFHRNDTTGDSLPEQILFTIVEAEIDMRLDSKRPCIHFVDWNSLGCVWLDDNLMLTGFEEDRNLSVVKQSDGRSQSDDLDVIV
ncbi:hypothetical protein WICPIJ_003597 [Wickerhamomyces pijperi]|uniref:Uncharacterized protein n=1 Tax=Wickerhamomyces pijperi TaxID=599730 RepID=A0A9P8Q9N5_WICPI|nr:hypothetical protein WICPIJ_003597 [Wickerhamomyces pijperi]